MSKKHKIALLLTLLLALMLITLGLYILTLADIVRFRQWPYYMLPRGEIVIAVGIALAVFCKQVSHYLLWLGSKLYRVIAALLVVALIGADVLLHLFSIPHVEGWWLSLASSLIAASGISAWVETVKKRHSHE
jgi:hypothetical protein